MDKNWKNKLTEPAEDEQKTQIVPRFAQSDATQIVKPPIPNDATQIVPPPIRKDDSDSIAEGIFIEEDIPEGIIVEQTVIVQPPIVEDYRFKAAIPPPNYEEPKRNMTVIFTPQPKSVEVEPAPMEHRAMGGGERNDPIPAFVKWIGGLALLVLLLNLGYCALQLN
ncbi:MAG: hypothetical protein RLZZ628_918 [Bacteroidota bacterium]|jgi:hypothetical protein